MYKQAALLTFYAETPIHMGTGQSVSYVDLPVQRERHTSYPVLWASGIKGVIKDAAMRVWDMDNDKVNAIFGFEGNDSEDTRASCVSFTDAKILFYPVRSGRGVFAWITCPFVLERFKNDLKNAGINCNGLDNIPQPTEGEIIICGPTKEISAQDSFLEIRDKGKVVLEEFVFTAKKEDLFSIANSITKLLPDNSLTASLGRRMAIVSDDIFKNFINYAVEIRTRIKIDPTSGTVEDKALFTEEYVPSESIFYSLVFIADPYLGIDANTYKKLSEACSAGKKWDDLEKEIEDSIKNEEGRIKKAFEGDYFCAKGVFEAVGSLFNAANNLIQLGSNGTTGKGLMRVKFYIERDKVNHSDDGGKNEWV
ncbi:MAG: type III-B CRISPR module RAMP protein Cmr4 [Tepidanaerobacteraceae bacterium]|jgi:CRISPR-associated protein Cmr4|nr:type III-B CRISPR module RAMP protein Cmr4 [Tepidanaerobacteraceae bacterium]